MEGNFEINFYLQEIDPNKDGWVFPKDFKDKMEQSKNYTELVFFVLIDFKVLKYS